jgi:hypothetical protein
VHLELVFSRKQARACTETHINVSVRFSFQGPSGRTPSVWRGKTLKEAAPSVNRKSPYFFQRFRVLLRQWGRNTYMRRRGVEFRIRGKFAPAARAKAARFPQGFHARVGFESSRKGRLSGSLAGKPQPLRRRSGKAVDNYQRAESSSQNAPDAATLPPVQSDSQAEGPGTYVVVTATSSRSFLVVTSACFGGSRASLR